MKVTLFIPSRFSNSDELCWDSGSNRFRLLELVSRILYGSVSRGRSFLSLLSEPKWATLNDRAGGKLRDSKKEPSSTVGKSFQEMADFSRFCDLGVLVPGFFSEFLRSIPALPVLTQIFRLLLDPTDFRETLHRNQRRVVATANRAPLDLATFAFRG